MFKCRYFWLLLAVWMISGSSFAQTSGLRFSVVDDTGSPYIGLTPEDISISFDKVTARPASLKIDDDAINLLILVDASTSQERSLPFEKKAVEFFIDDAMSAGKDRIGIAKFSNEVRLAHDLTRDFAAVKSKLNEIRFVPPPGYLGGGVILSRQGPPPPQARGPSIPGATSLFDSIEQAIIALSQPNPGAGRNAILVVSDGFVTSGTKKLADVVKASTAARIPIYTIGIGDDLYEGVDEKTLKKLSAETGGVAIFPKKASKLGGEIPKLANALRSSYLALLSKDDPRGEVSIEILNPNLRKKLRVFSPREF